MPTYVSLLRGLNVGGNNRLKMTDLKAIYQDISLDDAVTYLQSGNVVFRSPSRDRRALAKSIAVAIQQTTGMDLAVLVRSSSELAKVLAANPFPQAAHDDPNHLLVMFLAEAPTQSSFRAMADAYAGPELMKLSGTHLYIHYVNGIGTSKLTGAAIEKKLGTVGTGRNWNTVEALRKIAAEIR